MVYLRFYDITVGQGRQKAMANALDALALHVKALPGCLQVDVCQDNSDPLRHIFVERWSQEAAWAASGVPAHLLARVQEASAEPSRVRTATLLE